MSVTLTGFGVLEDQDLTATVTYADGGGQMFAASSALLGEATSTATGDAAAQALADALGGISRAEAYRRAAVLVAQMLGVIGGET